MHRNTAKNRQQRKQRELRRLANSAKQLEAENERLRTERDDLKRQLSESREELHAACQEIVSSRLALERACANFLAADERSDRHGARIVVLESWLRCAFEVFEVMRDRVAELEAETRDVRKLRRRLQKAHEQTRQVQRQLNGVRSRSAI